VRKRRELHAWRTRDCFRRGWKISNYKGVATNETPNTENIFKKCKIKENLQ